MLQIGAHVLGPSTKSHGMAPCLVEPKVCRAGALRLSLIKKEGVRDSSIKKCMG